MIAFTTVTGWTCGTRNRHQRALGKVARENMLVRMKPGTTRLVRTLGALYLWQRLEAVVYKMMGILPLVELVAQGLVQRDESCLGSRVVTDLATTDHTKNGRHGDLEHIRSVHGMNEAGALTICPKLFLIISGKKALSVLNCPMTLTSKVLKTPSAEWRATRTCFHTGADPPESSQG
jgi:hypothetical protein